MVDAVYTGCVDKQQFYELVSACAFPASAYFLAETLPAKVIKVLEGQRYNYTGREKLVCFCEFNRNQPFTDYTFGRIFSEDAELRWLKNDRQQLQVVYIGAANKHFDLLQQTHLLATSENELVTSTNSDDYKNHLYTKETRTYYLFGIYLEPKKLEDLGLEEPETGNLFAELRIPYVQHYPPTHNNKLPKERVYLQVNEYTSSRTGQCEFFRFQTLKADVDKPKKTN